MTRITTNNRSRPFVYRSDVPDKDAAFEVRNDTRAPALFTLVRAVRQHSGWQSVRYAGRRYQLCGGIRGPYYINLSRPITKKA